MKTHGVGKTDIGRQRTNNEDSFLVDDALGLYAVCDGMGGATAGEVAASTALEAVAGHLREALAGGGGPSAESRCRLLAEALEEASRQVFRKASAEQNLFGMGCTLTLLHVGGRHAAMAHVGDTRLYLYRKGCLRQLSVDHTLVHELADMGCIATAQMRTHPLAHVLTRSIGGAETVEVDTFLVDVMPGDIFLLCSDGLTTYVEDPDWLAHEIGDEPFEELPAALVNFANASGGVDNVTVIAVRVERDHDEGIRPRARGRGVFYSKGSGFKKLRDDSWPLQVA